MVVSTTRTVFVFVGLLSVTFLALPSNGFTASPKSSSLKRSTQMSHANSKRERIPHSLTCTRIKKASASALCASPKFTMPSQEESVELGIREWPQTTKNDEAWSEQAAEGQTLVRYILQGSGTVTIDNDVEKPFNTGLLIEVEGPASLEWKKGAMSDPIIILTPGFENVGLFAGALVGFVALCGALVALS
mmetsp:Transcript_6470/g.7433  ORF Transcript_6470/g.7433 Transcript_6470/m.7433 type:complete len:190 (+) Transcript_6470:142-711(+)|eukprot:CAMPEP_0204649212 /NCGR_PEP_ID=MMETSP0718-20130828/9226_1 /ASSEMBLY_ACC=CAM_ASM_000674 /TAXON_ID=230516 /ORGANISM="Chaetoceros curvisetus" /LENGTH=189 /DNA_ID=CAMNT_0051672237 /DNA_START=59 /DNA_END=628 /DNA_ORIENTATION=+